MSEDKLWFRWNGVESYAHGVEVLKLPEIYTPARRGSAYTVPGANGDVWVPDGGLEGLVLTAECYLPYEQETPVSDLASIRAWLSGDGWWEQSDLPGRRFRAQLRDAVAFLPVLEGFDDRTFTLVLYAEPYQYHYPEGKKIELDAPGGFRGLGNYPAAPLIAIYGTGDATVEINGEEIELAGLTGGALLDSELRACLLLDGETDGSGLVTGIDEFPMLIPGENTVSWSGGVTRIVITPRWRDT